MTEQIEMGLLRAAVDRVGGQVQSLCLAYGAGHGDPSAVGRRIALAFARFIRVLAKAAPFTDELPPTRIRAQEDVDGETLRIFADMDSRAPGSPTPQPGAPALSGEVLRGLLSDLESLEAELQWLLDEVHGVPPS